MFNKIKENLQNKKEGIANKTKEIAVEKIKKELVQKGEEQGLDMNRLLTENINEKIDDLIKEACSTYSMSEMTSFGKVIFNALKNKNNYDKDINNKIKEDIINNFDKLIPENINDKLTNLIVCIVQEHGAKNILKFIIETK